MKNLVRHDGIIYIREFEVPEDSLMYAGYALYTPKTKKDRVNKDVRVGQVWASSDPRRLSSFRIVDITSDVVTVQPVYPKGGYSRALLLDAFQKTGPKGYKRLS